MDSIGSQTTAARRSVSNEAPRALVTGATGALGPPLIERLLAEGYRVRVLVRQTSLPSHLQGKVEVCHGTITDSNTLQAAVTNIDVVFHLAAKLHINNPAPELRAEYQSINVEGTRRLVEAGQAAGVRRLVYFSSICVYGPTSPDQILDETSPVHPDSLYAETKYEAEALALRAERTPGGERLAVVLRLGAVYGPRVKGNYARLMTALRRRMFMPIGSGLNRRTLVYDQDVATAALLAAEHPAAGGQVYNVTDGYVHTLNDIVAAICQALDRSPPRFHLPVAPFNLLATAVEAGFRLVGRQAPLGRATVGKVLEDVAVSGARIQRELGFQPRFDLITGWRQSVQEQQGREPAAGHRQAAKG